MEKTVLKRKKVVVNRRKPTAHANTPEKRSAPLDERPRDSYIVPWC
ncbi:MAG: hypothetical protein GXP16_12660 [Gammaproteobacteria bacterium]|nr:hypothetical protein [Gammaproteobacteria bacterium]